MKDDNAKRLRANRVWLTADSCDLEEFKGQVERSTNRADYPFASDVASNVLVYDGLEAREVAASPESRKELLAEWVDAFTDGPPQFWGEVQPPASLKGLDIPPRRAVFVPWKPSRRPAFGMGNPTFRSGTNAVDGVALRAGIPPPSLSGR